MTAYQHIHQGAGAPATAPESLGAHYIDTTSKQQYLAVGTASAADWVLQPKAIQSSAVDGSGHLIITYTDSSTADVGLVKGADGAEGADGRGIASVSIDVTGHLIVTYSDTTTADLGLVEGADGANGADGRGITSATIDGSGHLIITYTDTTTADLGLVKGADGAVGADGTAGADGVGVQSVSIDGNKHLIVTLTNAATVDAGLLPAGAGLEVGDALFTVRTPGAEFLLQGSTQLQASYPDLFDVVGLVGGTPNNGTTWELKSFGAALDGYDSAIDSLAGLATDGNGVWVGGHWSGVFVRSTDNGATWASVAAGEPESGTAPRLVYTDRAGVWLATIEGGGLGLLRSTDNGATWTHLDSLPPFTALAYGNGVWMAGTGTNTQRSTDGGVTWDVVSDGVANANWSPTMLATDGAGAWVGWGTDGSTGRYIITSTDNGETWTQVANPVASNNDANAIGYCGGGAFALSGSSNSVIYRSIDNGATWTALPALTGAVGLFARNSAAVLAASQYFIARSTDNGATWAEVSISGLVGNSPQSIAMSETTAIASAYITGGGQFIASLSTFPYDPNTEFAVPEITAPAGTVAYVKAV